MKQLVIKKISVLTLALLAAVVAAALKGSAQFWSSSPSQQKIASEAEHRLHNGGKPRPQVELSTPDSTPLVANAWALTPILLTPLEECDELVVQFHGIDGIEVQDPQQTYNLGSCDPGEPRQVEVRIRGSSGVAGYLVADFTLITPETDKRKGSLTLPFQVGQAKHRPKPAGKTKIAPDGSSFIELNPQAQ